MHKHKTGTVRKCLYFNECGINEIHDGIKWKYSWFSYKDSLICHRHYQILIANPKETKEYRKKYNDKKPKGWSKKYDIRRILFKNKRIRLEGVPRKGQCERCGKKIGDEFINAKGKTSIIKRTNRHHWFYLIIMPWACTEELCMPCHRDRHDE